MSTYDVLRNVARVSTKFKKLSVDPFLIRKIEIHERQWTNAQIRGCMKVLKKSQNLKSFSFDLNWNFDAPVYKRFLKALSTFNHPNLEEFCIKGKNSDSSNNGDVWFKEVSLIKKLMKYLKKCPNLKILKFEYERGKHTGNYRFLEWLLANQRLVGMANRPSEDICRRIKFPNLEELHFNGFDFDYICWFDFGDYINRLCKNSPKLKRLCFKVDNLGILDCSHSPEYDKILHKIASERNIKIEITGTRIYRRSSILEVVHPSSGYRIFHHDTIHCESKSSGSQPYI